MRIRPTTSRRGRQPGRRRATLLDAGENEALVPPFSDEGGSCDLRSLHRVPPAGGRRRPGCSGSVDLRWSSPGSDASPEAAHCPRGRGQTNPTHATTGKEDASAKPRDGGPPGVDVDLLGVGSGDQPVIGVQDGEAPLPGTDHALGHETGPRWTPGIRRRPWNTSRMAPVGSTRVHSRLAVAPPVGTRVGPDPARHPGPAGATAPRRWPTFPRPVGPDRRRLRCAGPPSATGATAARASRRGGAASCPTAGTGRWWR